MVRDNLHKLDVKLKKPSGWADAQTQTEAPEDLVGPEQTLTSAGCGDADSELEFLQWNKLSFEEEPEAWQQVSSGSYINNRQACHANGRLVIITDHLHT